MTEEKVGIYDNNEALNGAQLDTANWILKTGYEEIR